MSVSTPVSWLKRDVLLFALSIGCKVDELQFLYELHPEFQVFPTYPVILCVYPQFKQPRMFLQYSCLQEVIPYSTTLPHPPIPTLTPPPPALDPSKVVDGLRHLTVHHPLPTSTVGRNFRMRKSIVGVYDKGSGTVVHSLHQLVDEDVGRCYSEVHAHSFYVGQGGWGGLRGPKVEDVVMPSREADIVAYERSNTESSLLYRLNGDYNPLHATPEPGTAMGFPGVIMHGLVAWNMCAHAVIRSFGESRGCCLVEFEARFAAPVLPGDHLCIQMWVEDDPQRAERIEVRFLCKVGERVVLKAGRALLKRRI
ncbi:Thioesterase/thiol ester dehydrase-isomerase [Glarea lozoyensis ATCC 20868]|uniref:Thioesterase/thiol ester dehydrase-isomerase n=1 Tax=Glarea lozoyensis (strain ATCC 20868 / MF5171) TaxID=1116229 RepID=S3CYH4_GLAL2|nr:Thioesterase/thiol ester dehydrase-isomerase [Glarea lozoyensis ATCC 20868]EPE30655.1 Thioesterase/thiol ester dehydrase-isomerase [Glarea lozoyensis ATCC 20868]